MIAQGSHASLGVILDQLRKVDWMFDLLPLATKEWLTGRFVKIVVSVSSKEELLETYEKAKGAGIPCSLIEDAGFTEFGGVPTYTAVGIGPDYPERIDPITKELPLL